MKKALIVGGGNGIGLAVAYRLLEKGCEKIVVFDRDGENIPNDERFEFVKFDLLHDDYSRFDSYTDIDTLFITAGFGRLAMFEDLDEQEIINGMRVNAESVMRVIKHFYNKIKSREDFFCGVMGSITGLINSPLFSVYSASKGALLRFIEALNSELEYSGFSNRILNCSPGAVKGTRFYGAKENALDSVKEFSEEFVTRTLNRELLYIPDYDKVYKGVIERHLANPQKYGLESIEYKKNSGRMDKPSKSNIKVGYMSGTFDLFHIGHLNILRRAKEHCDYLVVGVHPSAAHKGKEAFIPFEERRAIVENIGFVDKVIEAPREDLDAYKNGIVKYDYLFVGSDYKGTERFAAYEDYFKDKGVEIVYFPYTKGTSSTQLRDMITRHTNEDNGGK